MLKPKSFHKFAVVQLKPIQAKLRILSFQVPAPYTNDMEIILNQNKLFNLHKQKRTEKLLKISNF